MRNACCAVQSRSSIEILYDLEPLRNANSVSKKWLGNKRLLTTVFILTMVGIRSMVLTDAKSAVTDCGSSYSSADSAICVPAGDAAPIGFRLGYTVALAVNSHLTAPHPQDCSGPIKRSHSLEDITDLVQEGNAVF